MNTNQIQVSTPPRQQPRSLSGRFLGRQWSFSLWPAGAGRQEEHGTLPETVGTVGVVLPFQGVRLILDFEHAYLAGADNRLATCRIRVYSPVHALLPSIAQEMPGLCSPNAYDPQELTIILCEPLVIDAITNRTEEIATSVWHQLGRPCRLTWIEYHPKNSSPIECNFQCVQFRCNAHGVLVDPQWTDLRHPVGEALLVLT